MDDIHAETDRQATQFVIERNALQVHMQAIAAAWEIWSEALFDVRRLARTNEWAGDMPDGRQRADMIAQHNAQIFEAYARARVQCAIAAANGDGDMVETFDQHWTDTWGAVTTTKARAAYVDQLEQTIEKQRERRAAAQRQTAALEAAGVRSDLGPAP